MFDFLQLATITIELLTHRIHFLLYSLRVGVLNGNSVFGLFHSDLEFYFTFLSSQFSNKQLLLYIHGVQRRLLSISMIFCLCLVKLDIEGSRMPLISMFLKSFFHFSGRRAKLFTL